MPHIVFHTEVEYRKIPVWHKNAHPKQLTTNMQLVIFPDKYVL